MPDQTRPRRPDQPHPDDRAHLEDIDNLTRDRMDEAELEHALEDVKLDHDLLEELVPKGEGRP